jgi:dihydroxyacetone kinase-like protein
MGVTSEFVSRAITEVGASSAEDDIGKLLVSCGIEINRRSPSTLGTLLASASVEAGKAAIGRKEIGIPDFVLLGRGAIDGIRKRGKSEIGEKTMLDSLVPAVEAFEKALTEGAGHKVAIESAIEAAKAGAEKTIEMRAKHGRAVYRQDRGAGIQDPGATAIYYLLESFGKALIDYSTKQTGSIM